MLDFLRRSANSVVVKGLLALLVASFALWGIQDVFRSGGGGNAVATVGEAEIGVQTYQAELARELDRVSQMLGQNITREQARAMGVDNMLLSRLVNSELIQQGAAELGLLASDQVVLKEIQSNPDFFNKDGAFDRTLFTSLLQQNGMNEAMYVERVRRNMARAQYLSPIALGTVAPKVLVEALYKTLSETRVLDVVRIPHLTVQNVPAPTEQDLANYHEDNAAKFMAPEYRALTALLLSAEDAAKGIEITPAELQAAYDERAAEYMTPEKRVLAQVLTKDEDTAKLAAAALDAGKSVAEAAAQVGANPAMGKLGAFSRAEAEALSAGIAAAAFTTAKGGHSAPVQSPLGWHVLVVEDVTPGLVRTLDEVKDELAAALRTEKAQAVLFDTSNRVQDLLGGGMTLEEAAKELGASLIQAAAVDATGKTPEGTDAPLPYLGELLAPASDLGQGQESQLTETQDNKAFFVVRVDDVTQPRLRALSEVTAQVTALWSADKRAELAAKLAEEAKTRLEAGEDARAVAQAVGGDAFTTEPFTRTGQGLEQGALPATVMEEAFTLAVGKAVLGEGTGAHTVARLKSVQGTEVDAASPLYQALVERTTGDLQGDLAAQLTQALQARHPVQLNEAVLNSLNATNN